MDCSLLASGIFLKTEIISTQPKMPGTRAVLSCRLCLSPQPSWGSSGHSARALGHSGWQPGQPEHAREGGLWGSLQEKLFTVVTPNPSAEPGPAKGLGEYQQTTSRRTGQVSGIRAWVGNPLGMMGGRFPRVKQDRG